MFLPKIADSFLFSTTYVFIYKFYKFLTGPIYRTRDEGKFELFNRLISQRHFEKVKLLFNVKTPKELQEKITTIQVEDKNPDRIRYSNSFESVIPIYRLIDIEKIGTIR